MKKVILLQLIVLTGFWILFMGFQHESVYSKSLGLISKNWQNKSGEITRVKKPFNQLTNENYIQWDAVHYQFIKNFGYNIEKAGGDYIFAFFPLFPLIWKFSGLPAIGILFLNYLFFSISTIILLNILTKSENYLRNAMLILSFPSIIMFFIPYSEAIFLLTVSIAIYGFVKDKYWIFFIGILLASLTRPSYFFLVFSIIGVEFFYFFQHKNWSLLWKNLFFRIIPLLLGTVIVSIFQFIQHSGSFFKFIEVQKYWKNTLSVPHNLRDWSQEGFAISIGVLFLIIVPLTVLVFQLFKNQLTKIKFLPTLEYKKPNDYLLVLSMIYLIGNALFILLFRDGSIHGLFRFTICSPFFFVLIFIGYEYIKDTPAIFRTFIIGILSMVSILILGLTDYSTNWNSSDYGLFIFLGTMLLWNKQDKRQETSYYINLSILLSLNIIWTTYLFNMYIGNGWIFG